MNKFLAIAWLLIGVSALGQTSIERMGGRLNIGPTARQAEVSAWDEARRREAAAEQQARSNALRDTNSYRVVRGQLYNMVLSTNWVKLPGFGRRMEFLELTRSGAAFEIYKVRYDGGLDFDRMVVLTNFPGARKLLTGAKVSDIRAMPVGNSKVDGLRAVVFDCGTIPSGTNYVAHP